MSFLFNFNDLADLLTYGSYIYSGMKIIRILFRGINIENNRGVKNKVNLINNKNNVAHFICYNSEEELKYLKEEYSQYLECPILQNTIRFPVINQYGITYDKNNIINWLNQRQTCPTTNGILSVNDLRPNLNVKNFVKFLILMEKYNMNNPMNKIRKEDILD